MSARSKAANRNRRSVARLAAVQALYQMEVAGVGVDAVIREFTEHRFEGAPDHASDADGALGAADEAYFGAIVRGVVSDQAAIDRAIVKRLASGWKLERLDATTRAALRAGAYELTSRLDTPVEVVIDEYVELAKGFNDETAFLNAALDAIARDVRPPAPSAPPGGG